MSRDRTETAKEDTHFSFSFARLRDLPPAPEGKRVRYHDTKVSGLVLRVSSTGAKTFYVYKWFGAIGKPLAHPIGPFPTVSIEKAREIAAARILEMRGGKNPNAAKKALRDEMTLEELFEYCLENHFKVHNRSWKEYENIFRRYLLKLAKRPLSAITRDEIHTLHARIGRDNGIYSANRTLALLSILFNKARLRGFEKGNPVQGIKKFRERSRERFLEAHELPAFLRAVADEENQTVRDYVYISLLTGARKTNVLSMRWKDVNLKSKIWEISETKNGTSQRVPLVSEAVRILSERAGNGSEFVFPSETGQSYFSDPKKGWSRILERAGIENLRMHDLRRSLGSWQAATGANLSVIGKTLNHKTVSTTAIYARLNIDPVREAVEKATKAMWAAGEASTIVPQRKR